MHTDAARFLWKPKWPWVKTKPPKPKATPAIDNWKGRVQRKVLVERGARFRCFNRCLHRKGARLVPGTPYLTAWANSGKSGRARREQGGERDQPRYLVPESGWPHSLFSGTAQVLAHESWPRIGRPRHQGRAGGIGCMAYQTMARNCSEKKLNSGKIAASLSRAGQIIQRKSIDQREQTQTIEETISNHGEHRAHGEGEHARCSPGGRGNPAWDRQDQEIATRGSRLRAATLGSWPSLLVSASRVRRKDAPGS